MRKFTKRTLALILTLALVLTVMPLGVASALQPPPISTGAFDDSADGVAGASWRLESGGTLVVGSGFIEWYDWHSPWDYYSENITTIIFTGPITAGYSLRGLFYDLANVTAIEGLAYFDTSNVESMEGVFAGASALTSLDLSSWDTSNVDDMGGMFAYASNLTSLDLSGWDTGNVEFMDGMFYYATALESLDIAHFDTGSVEDMGFMFHSASSLTTLNLSGWNTSNVEFMDWLFAHASGLTSLDLSRWDTRNVTDMGRMFDGTYSLRELTLGEHFRFVDSDFSGNAMLPNIPVAAEFTGRWHNTRTDAVSTSAQLMAAYDSAASGTWIWQRRVRTERNISVIFGATQYFLDGDAFTQQTMVYNGVAYLPAAYLARRLGLTAQWDAATDTTTLTSTGNPPPDYVAAATERATPVTRSINAIFGATQYLLDGEAFTQDTLVYDGVAYLPAAYLARRLGLTAQWDAATDTTTLTTIHPLVPTERRGTIVLELYPNYAPLTVENFVGLVSQGFYDGIVFHRIVDGFMAQGGCPQGMGIGGSGTNIVCETIGNGWTQNTLSHTPGVISMAHAGTNTGSSQFFIMLGDWSHLDGHHTGFGRVVEGFEVVEQFQEVERTFNSMGERASPIRPVTIVSATVLEDSEDGNPRVQMEISWYS